MRIHAHIIMTMCLIYKYCKKQFITLQIWKDHLQKNAILSRISELTVYWPFYNLWIAIEPNQSLVFASQSQTFFSLKL